MRIIKDLGELAGLVGEELGTGPWLRIDQARIDAFAEATGDHQWIHVDPARAAGGPFGTTIAHGLLTLSLVPFLSSDVYRVEGSSMGVNYGYERVRFTSPVPVGSRVRARLELLGVEQAGEAARVALRVTVELEGCAKPACVLESLSLLCG